MAIIRTVVVNAEGPQGAKGDQGPSGSQGPPGSVSSAFPFSGSAVITGSLLISGSNLTVLGSVTSTSFTGSLLGTSSFSINAITASYIDPLFISASAASYGFGNNAPETDPIFTAVSASLVYTSSFNAFTSSIQSQVNNLTTATSSFVNANQTGSFTLTSSFNSFTASYTTGSFLGNINGTASWAQNASQAVTASYASNGGVTQLLAGPNISLSPTTGLGQVTISSTGGGGSSFNTATGSYGSFYDTTTQTNPVGNVPRSMSLNTTAITNGVSVSGSTNPFNTYIKTENAGIYNIQFSAQLDKTDSGTDEIVIWLRKNGIDLIDTATTVSLVGNNSKNVAAWNWFVTSAANDYYQIIWLSADIDMRLLAETISATHPGIPSVIVTANRVDQFMSNTGSFSGTFTGDLIGTASFATTSSYTQNALSASYALTASYALNGGGGGSGTPQGLPTQIQYNNGGSFGGVDKLTFDGTNLVGTGSFTGSFTGQFNGSITTAQTASHAVNFTIEQKLTLDETLTDFAKISNSIAGSPNLFEQATGSYTSAHGKYTLYNGANARAGEFVTVWNGTSTTYYDNATTDIGTTSDITFQSTILTSQIQINAVTATSGWTVKMLVTYL